MKKPINENKASFLKLTKKVRRAHPEKERGQSRLPLRHTKSRFDFVKPSAVHVSKNGRRTLRVKPSATVPIRPGSVRIKFDIETSLTQGKAEKGGMPL